MQGMAGIGHRSGHLQASAHAGTEERPPEVFTNKA